MHLPTIQIIWTKKRQHILRQYIQLISMSFGVTVQNADGYGLTHHGSIVRIAVQDLTRTAEENSVTFHSNDSLNLRNTRLNPLLTGCVLSYAL